MSTIRRWGIGSVFFLAASTLALAQTVEDKLRTIDANSKDASYRQTTIYPQLEGFSKTDLLAALDHENPEVKECGCLLLAKFANDLSKGEAEKIAILLHDKLWRVRGAAAELLGKNTSVGEPILRELMGTSTGETAVSAAIGLVEEPNGADPQLKQTALMAIFNSLAKDPGPDFTALNYLINHPHPEAAGWLKSAVLRSQLPSNFQSDAADILSHWMAQSNADEAGPVFLDMLESDNESVRFAAVRGIHETRALRVHPDAGILTALRREAENAQNSGQTKEWILMCLAEIKDKAALPAFLEGLKNPNPAIVAQAVKGVAAVGAVEALPDLVEVLRKGNQRHEKLSLLQMDTGNLIASLAKRRFKFSYLRFCGNTGYEEMVEEANKVGGEKGAAILAQAEAEEDQRKAIIQAEIASNLAERERLLKWWDHKHAVRAKGASK